AAGSTASTPAYTPDRIGGITRITRTTMLGMRKASSPSILGPNHKATAKSRPRVGTARSELATLTSHLARPVWPTHSPNGIAITAAMTTASREYQRWSMMRAPNPELPDQVAEEVSHSRMRE